MREGRKPNFARRANATRGRVEKNTRRIYDAVGDYLSSLVLQCERRVRRRICCRPSGAPGERDLLANLRGLRDISRSCLAGCDTVGRNKSVALTHQQILLLSPRSRCPSHCPRVVLARRTHRGARPPSASASEAWQVAGGPVTSFGREASRGGRATRHASGSTLVRSVTLFHCRRSTREGGSVFLSLSARVSSDASSQSRSTSRPPRSSCSSVGLIRRGWRSRLRLRALRRRLTWR